MKKYTTLALLAGILALSQCKSKQKTATTAEVYTPSEKQMAIVEQRWPQTGVAEVQQGQNIFVTRCTTCHGAKEITRFSEKKWLHEIDDMSPKAKLSAEEKLILTKYILSYREAFASAAK